MNSTEIRQEIETACKKLAAELTEKLIQKEEPKEFLPNRWYKHHITNMYVFNIKFGTKGNSNTGFICGEFAYSIACFYRENWQLVTDYTELDQLLKNELVKRGIVYKSLVKSVRTGATYEITDDTIEFDKNRTEILYDVIAVFENGKFAEVVKEKTTKDWLNELDNNYKLEVYQFFKDNNLKIVKE